MTAALPKSSFLDASRVAKLQLRATYLVAGNLARRHVMAEAEVLGLTLPKAPPPKSDFLSKLGGDLLRALADTSLSDKEKVRRCQIAASSAANRGYTEAQLAAYRILESNGAKIEKLWQVTTTGTPCDDCRDLHGSSVPIDQEFKYKGKVYADLQGPPRHPFCRCRVVLRLKRR